MDQLNISFEEEIKIEPFDESNSCSEDYTVVKIEEQKVSDPPAPATVLKSSVHSQAFKGSTKVVNFGGLQVTIVGAATTEPAPKHTPTKIPPKISAKDVSSRGLNIMGNRIFKRYITPGHKAPLSYMRPSYENMIVELKGKFRAAKAFTRAPTLAQTPANAQAPALVQPTALLQAFTMAEAPALAQTSTFAPATEQTQAPAHKCLAESYTEQQLKETKQLLYQVKELLKAQQALVSAASKTFEDKSTNTPLQSKPSIATTDISHVQDNISQEELVTPKRPRYGESSLLHSSTTLTVTLKDQTQSQSALKPQTFRQSHPQSQSQNGPRSKVQTVVQRNPRSLLRPDVLSSSQPQNPPQTPSQTPPQTSTQIQSAQFSHQPVVQSDSVTQSGSNLFQPKLEHSPLIQSINQIQSVVPSQQQSDLQRLMQYRIKRSTVDIQDTVFFHPTPPSYTIIELNGIMSQSQSVSNPQAGPNPQNQQQLQYQIQNQRERQTESGVVSVKVEPTDQLFDFEGSN